MKKIVFLFVLLLSSCYTDEDMNDYPFTPKRQSEYFWYYNHEMFDGVESVQLIGYFESKYSDEKHYVNRSCKVSNDTLYIIKRYIYPLHYIYNGTIRTDKKEYGVSIILK